MLFNLQTPLHMAVRVHASWERALGQLEIPYICGSSFQRDQLGRMFSIMASSGTHFGRAPRLWLASIVEYLDIDLTVATAASTALLRHGLWAECLQSMNLITGSRGFTQLQGVSAIQSAMIAAHEHPVVALPPSASLKLLCAVSQSAAKRPRVAAGYQTALLHFLSTISAKEVQDMGTTDELTRYAQKPAVRTSSASPSESSREEPHLIRRLALLRGASAKRWSWVDCLAILSSAPQPQQQALSRAGYIALADAARDDDSLIRGLLAFTRLLNPGALPLQSVLKPDQVPPVALAKLARSFVSSHRNDEVARVSLRVLMHCLPQVPVGYRDRVAQALYGRGEWEQALRLSGERLLSWLLPDEQLQLRRRAGAVVTHQQQPTRNVAEYMGRFSIAELDDFAAKYAQSNRWADALVAVNVLLQKSEAAGAAAPLHERVLAGSLLSAGTWRDVLALYRL